MAEQPVENARVRNAFTVSAASVKGSEVDVFSLPRRKVLANELGWLGLWNTCNDRGHNQRSGNKSKDLDTGKFQTPLDLSQRIRAVSSPMGYVVQLSRLIAFVSFLAFPSVLAANPVGQVVDVTQNATITRDGQQSYLQQSQSVVLGDVVGTGSTGQVQLLFRDDTKIVIGPNSQLIIESILFDNSDTASDFTVNAVKGAFRFFSGKSEKSTYAIRTPNATMGIRGTVFDFTVSP